MHEIPRGGEERGWRTFGPWKRLIGTLWIKLAWYLCNQRRNREKTVAVSPYDGSLTSGCGQTKTKKLEIPGGRG
jgi:hypothetical protein